MSIRSLMPLLLIGYIALELIGFSVFVQQLGFLALLIEIMLSGGFGIWLWILHTHSLSALLNDIFDLLARRRIFDLLKVSMLVYIGAFLLVLPGLFGDIIGLCLIILSFILRPHHTRNEFKRRFDDFHKQNDLNDFEKNDFRFYFSQNTNDRMRQPKQDEEIIDVEVVESYTEVSHTRESKPKD